MRSFVAYTDAWLAEQAGAPERKLVRLNGGALDLTEIIFAWEHDLRGTYPPPSKCGYELVTNLLALIAQRHARRRCS